MSTAIIIRQLTLPAKTLSFVHVPRTTPLRLWKCPHTPLPSASSGILSVCTANHRKCVDYSANSYCMRCDTTGKHPLAKANWLPALSSSQPINSTEIYLDYSKSRTRLLSFVTSPFPLTGIASPRYVGSGFTNV